MVPHRTKQLFEHPSPNIKANGQFLQPVMLLAAFFFFLEAFLPLPPVFGKPQLISKHSVAAGGWYKSLIICFSLGV